MKRINKRYLSLAPALYITAFIIITAPLSCFSQSDIRLDGHTVFRVDDDNVIEYTTYDKNAASPGDTSTIKSISDLPGSEDMEIINVYPTTEKDLVVITRKHGLYRVSGKSGPAKRIDSGLPPEVVYPFKSKGVTKPIVSHSVSRDKKRIAVIVPSSAYLSADGGKSFSKLPINGVRRFTELLSIALHPDKSNLILMGTAASGIYYSLDSGNTVKRIRRGMPGEPLRTPNFLEEVRSLSFGDDGSTFYAGLGSGNGVYRGSVAGKKLTKLDLPELYTYPDGDLYRVNSVNYYNGNVLMTTNRKWNKIIAVANPAAQNISSRLKIDFLKPEKLISIHTDGRSLPTPPHYQPRRTFKPDKRAIGVKAMYISYSFTQKDNYAKLIKLMKYLKLNAVVLNIKDDYGSIRIPVDDPVVTRVPDAVKPYKRILETIKKLQKDGIYVIARMVVFKDDKLYKYENGKYAIKNSAGFPLRKGPEKWVDAHSEYVWDYNIAIAKAMEKAGVNEIQFDYIRFPDIRGKKDRRKFDFKRKGQTMREALVSFLKKARENINIPVSIDVFGYNAVYKWGNWIGQDVTELSRYVDVLSPMFYPSHYTGGYGYSYGKKRIYYIIYLSCARARELTEGVHIRPYIQAFYYKDNSDNYCTDYIGWELDGLKKSGLSDYIWWNDLSEYKILIKGMGKYLGIHDGKFPAHMKNNIPKKLPFKTMVTKE